MVNLVIEFMTKKIVILLLFTAFFIEPISAQVTVIYATVLQTYTSEDDDAPFNWSKEQSGGVPIRIDLDNNLIKIENGRKDVFKLVKLVDDEECQSADHHKFHVKQYHAIDKDGKGLQVGISKWEDGTISIMVMYLKTGYLYSGRKIEF